MLGRIQLGAPRSPSIGLRSFIDVRHGAALRWSSSPPCSKLAGSTIPSDPSATPFYRTYKRDCAPLGNLTGAAQLHVQSALGGASGCFAPRPSQLHPAWLMQPLEEVAFSTWGDAAGINATIIQCYQRQKYQRYHIDEVMLILVDECRREVSR